VTVNAVVDVLDGIRSFLRDRPAAQVTTDRGTGTKIGAKLPTVTGGDGYFRWVAWRAASEGDNAVEAAA